MAFDFQRVLEAARVVEIVFDGVAGAQDVHVLHAADRADQRQLDVERQAGRHAVRVDLVCRQAFRLEEDVVLVLVGEAVDLVLDRRAVTRADAFDDAGVHRRTVEAAADDVVRALVGFGDPARQLARVLGGIAEEGKDRHRVVRMLLFHHREIDGLAVEAGRRAGLEAALRQVQLFQPGGQRIRGRIAHAAAGVVFQPDVDLAVEEGAGREHDSTGHEADAELRDSSDNALAFDDQVVAGFGEDGQIGLIFQSTADGLLVQNAVGLGAGGADGGAFRCVEDAELDAGFVGRRCHGAAQRIDLANQMALADTADRRIAAHRPERVEVVRQQQCVRTRPGCGKRGLGAGVTAADDDDIETGGIEHGIRFVAAQ